MKKTFALILVLLLAATLLAACQTGGGSSAAPPTSSPGPAPASSSHAASSGGSSAAASSSQAESSSSEDPNTEHSITGTIDDVAMGKVYVRTDDGLVIPFEYTSADISGWTNSRPGSRVTVYYTGTLNGNDTSGIQVTRITDAG